MNQLLLGAPEGLLELEIMIEKIGVRTYTQVCCKTCEAIVARGSREVA